LYSAYLINQITWRPTIGDPTLIGWLTVGAYFLSSILCISVVLSGLRRGEFNGAWLAITLLLFMLGFNKQLDLQSLLTEVGKISAETMGWYPYRRSVQLIVITLIVLASMKGISRLYRYRHEEPSLPLSVVAGVCYILTFICIRALSFHHFDHFIGSSILGLKWNWILELGGLFLISWGASATLVNLQELV
jgi:hypothetical protein